MLAAAGANPQLRQIFAQLLEILILNRVHPQLARTFQIQAAIINQHTFIRFALRNP